MISFQQPPISHHARFPYHGNYGGPEYTGAKFDGTDFSLKPVDLLDRSYREHDSYYHHGLERTGDIKHVNDVTRDWNKYSMKEKIKGGISALGFAAKSFISKDKLRDAATTGDADLHRLLPPHGPTNKEMHSYNGNPDHSVNNIKIVGRYKKIQPEAKYNDKANALAFAPVKKQQQPFHMPHNTALAIDRLHAQERSRPSPSNKSMHTVNGNIKSKTVAKKAGMRLGAPSVKKIKQKAKVKKQQKKFGGHTVASGVYNNPINKNKEGRQLYSCIEPCHDRLGEVDLTSSGQHTNGTVVFVFPCNLVNFGNRTQNLASMYSMWKSKLKFNIEICAPTSLGGEYTAFFDPDPEHPYVVNTTSVENTQRAYQMSGRKIFNPSKSRQVTVIHPGHPRNTGGLGPDGWLYTHAENSDERITEYGTFVIICTATTTAHTGAVFTVANNSNISFKNPDFNTTTLSDSLCAGLYATEISIVNATDYMQHAFLPVAVTSSSYIGTEVTPYIVNGDAKPTGLIQSTNSIGLRPGLYQVDLDVQFSTSAAAHTFSWTATSTNTTIKNYTIAIDPTRFGAAYGITATSGGVRASAVVSISDPLNISSIYTRGWIPKVDDGLTDRLAGIPCSFSPAPVAVGSFAFTSDTTVVGSVRLVTLSIRRLPPSLADNPKYGLRQLKEDRIDKLQHQFEVLQKLLNSSRASSPIHVEIDEEDEVKDAQADFQEMTKQYAPTAIIAKYKDGTTENLPLRVNNLEVSASFLNTLGALTGLAKPLAK